MRLSTSPERKQGVGVDPLLALGAGREAHAPTRCIRRGLSLLEVIVALAIFLFSFIVISRLVVAGGDLALEVQQRAQAARLCQSKLAEVAAGAVPLESQGDTPFDEEPDWYWALETEQGTVTGLWTVRVRVTRQAPDGSRVESTLSQMLLDPSLRGTNADAAATASSTSTESATTGQSGSSSSSSSSTGGATSGSGASGGSAPSGQGGGATGGGSAPAGGGGSGRTTSGGGRP
jgi:prepilin-type N-terminal cleavage/methylation domain-containing protein